MRLLGLLLLSLLALTDGYAQTTVGLIAHYRFDGDLKDATGNSANTGNAVGMPDYSCGVADQALLLNGQNDQVRILSNNDFDVNSELDNREDFTISFYFKSTGVNGIQYLLSKRDTSCMVNERNDFYIRYTPQIRTVEARLFEPPNKEVRISRLVPVGSCWQQVTLVRDESRVRLFINGEFGTVGATAGRINLDNEGKLLIGGSDCRSANETTFAGLIDELKVFNRALDDFEVAGLYASPDRILTSDTVIFLGNDLDFRLSPTCGTDFSWSPTSDLSDPNAAEPNLFPSMAGDFVYTLQVRDGVSNCIATDSIKVRVVDPDDLDCREVYLPKAFTPNNDGLNDEYGISNPFALQDMLSFEIFDRWGGRVFMTNEPFSRWDGSFLGQPVNPGVFLYRVRYMCEGEELVRTGSLTVMR